MSGVELIIGTLALATTIGNTITTGNNIKKFYKWVKNKDKKEKDRGESWQWIDNEEGDGGDFVKIEISNM